MADDVRQPPQAYDTVSPAGVGATTTNQQVSPGTVQEILDTHDQNLIEQAFEQMDDDALTRYLESLPDLPQTSSPAGVGSQGSFRSIQTSWESSPPSPLSCGSARLSPDPRTGAGAGGGGGGGRRAPRVRGGGRGGAGGGRGGAGGAGGGGGGGGGGGRRGRRPSRTPPTNPSTPRGSWSPGSHPRTLGQADLQRRLQMMLQDQEQLAQGRL